LFRLNLAAIRAKILFREGPSATRREHVEHFIETLDDRDLAKQLALLRLEDADMTEDTLRAYCGEVDYDFAKKVDRNYRCGPKYR